MLKISAVGKMIWSFWCQNLNKKHISSIHILNLFSLVFQVTLSISRPKTITISSTIKPGKLNWAFYNISIQDLCHQCLLDHKVDKLPMELHRAKKKRNYYLVKTQSARTDFNKKFNPKPMMTAAPKASKSPQVKIPPFTLMRKVK